MTVENAMEFLRKLGIPSSKANQPGNSLESSSDDYFLRGLIPVYMSDDGRGLLDEREGLLMRWTLMCQAFVKRQPILAQRWQDESDLWNLIRLVIPTCPSSDSGKPPRSTQAKVDMALRSDPILVHLVRLKEWLETITKPFIPAEIRKSTVPTGTGQEDTTYLDPDSMAGRLDPLDADYEEAQLQTLWNYLRRGRIQEAIAWCFQVDQPWRAAILSGGFLPSDPLLDGADGPVSGNPKRDIWKSSIRSLIKSSASACEKAVYGTLIGDLASTELLCRDWKDLLWALVNSILEQSIHEICLVGRCDSQKALRSLEAGFERIKGTNPALKHESTFCLVQFLVLLGSRPLAIEAVQFTNPEDVRLMAVALLILDRFSSLQVDPAHLDSVLGGPYLAHLGSTHNHPAWIFYCSCMTSYELQTDCLLGWFGRISRDEPKEVRQILLKEAESYGIRLAPALSQFIIQASCNGFDWLTFNPKSPLIVEYACYRLRPLLLTSAISQARAVMADIPDSIPLPEMILQPEPSSSFAKELVYYKDWLGILSIYEDWSTHYAATLSSPATHHAQEFQSVSKAFLKASIDFLADDWLSDVDPVTDLFFGTAADRESELASLRSKYLTDFVLIVLSVLGMASVAGQVTQEQLRLAEILADPELELWREFGPASRVALRERLLRLPSVSDPRWDAALSSLLSLLLLP